MGAQIDSALLTILENYLLCSKGNSSRLLEQDAPLGSLSAKIEISYRLGLTSSLMHRELHLIRKIRNIFAHPPLGVSFEKEPIKNWISELRIPQWTLEGRKDLLESGMFSSNKNKFILSGAATITLLTSIGNRIQKVEKHTPEFNGENLT